MKMVTLVTAMTLSLSALSASAAVAKAQSKDSKRIEYAATLLSSASDSMTSEQVSPTKDSDSKEILKKVATDIQGIEAEEFADYYEAEPADAWGADSMMYASASLADAMSYVTDFVLESLDAIDSENDKEEADKQKLKLANALISIQKAEPILKDLQKYKKVSFGIAPMGAVQCGVTFPALLIMDGTEGLVYVISNEGSGC